MELSSLALSVDLALLSTADGGRRKPLAPNGYVAFQYRPNWRPAKFEGEEQFGAPVLCFGTTPVEPGDRTRAVIVPAAEVSLPVWHTVRPEQRLEMFEGRSVLGVATVLRVDEIELPLSDDAVAAFQGWCLPET